MTAVIILAAGSSSRFGSAKQNLNYKGETLLQLAVNNAVKVSDTVLVVLGANRDDIEFSIKDKPVKILYNPLWAEGMASGIRLAIEKLQGDYLAITQVMIMLCDQPFADAAVLRNLMETDTEKGIIASKYNDIVGVPVLFKAKYFPYLIALQGKEGAKKLLELHLDDVEPVNFPLGSVDIDTTADWDNLNNQSDQNE
ncbi:nucleotidyltransferase family protein [Mucilaginibacter glaciei]|uniref:Nucleotidyltransferase family protein n=1 Tax=Mucilaginibacter glaciei TaxID=2772109 RepID=A0A926NIR4_9SPHI|nr:nucleotidyltransferase family protein [Mucilaginibacter glaciei]MBD1391986.1 nucleotidyltransferase family protein [Mucilaginibacter glaciei]